MTVQFGSITFVWGGEPEKVGQRLAELNARKGISLMAHHGDRGVVADGRDALNFLENRLALFDLPVSPFLLNKDKFDGSKGKAKEALAAIDEGLQDGGFKSLEDLCERFLLDRMLIKLEDGVDADGKPVNEIDADGNAVKKDED